MTPEIQHVLRKPLTQQNQSGFLWKHLLWTKYLAADVQREGNIQQPGSSGRAGGSGSSSIKDEKMHALVLADTKACGAQSEPMTTRKTEGVKVTSVLAYEGEAGDSRGMHRKLAGTRM